MSDIDETLKGIQVQHLFDPERKAQLISEAKTAIYQALVEKMLEKRKVLLIADPDDYLSQGYNQRAEEDLKILKEYFGVSE